MKRVVRNLIHLVTGTVEALSLQLYALLLGISMSLGAVILLGGAARFSSPSFDRPKSLVEWMPGAPHTAWGYIFLITGFMLLIGMGSMRVISYLIFAGAVYWFWAFGFFLSVLSGPEAALTATITYGGVGAAHILLAAHIRVGEPSRSSGG